MLQGLSEWRVKLFGAVGLIFLLVYPFDEAYLLSVFLLLVLGALSAKTIYRTWDAELNWTIYLGLLIAVPLLLTLVFAVNKEETFNDVLRFSLLGFVSALFVWHFRFGFSPFRWMLVFFGFQLFWIFDALLQYFSGANLLGNPMVSGRLTGLWYPGIIVGTVIAHSAPIFIEMVRRLAIRGGWFRLSWLLILPMLTVILLGGSRASWLAFLVAMTLYAFYLFWIKAISIKWLVTGVLLSIAAVLIMYQLMPEFRARADNTLQLFTWDYEFMNSATSGRLPIWYAAWMTFIENPWVGVGSDAVKDYAAARNWEGMWVRYAHMFVLDVLSMTGIIGFIGYAIFYSILMGHTWQSLKNRWDLTTVMFICALVMAFPLNTHFGFYNFRPVGLMWAFIALAYAFRLSERSKAAV
ncbi:O-antigen ligase family protein [Salinispirillum marinum]|uniref:O-antigen ligase family protein n=2 Tax=Saccharospirillaceae TaxID=255527 RepID=A0ABV8BE93_9GAMM